MIYSVLSIIIKFSIMYNGRAGQPYEPQQKQPFSSGADWSRPRKGSYCQYKQEKLNQVTNPNVYKEGSLGANLTRATTTKNIMNKSGIDVGSERRSSMNFYEKDQVRASQLGFEKYGSREIGDYTRATKNKYPIEQISYESRLTRPSTSSAQLQLGTKNYLQSYTPVSQEYKPNGFNLFSDAPAGTIVPAGQRKRTQLYQNTNQEAYEQNLKTRQMYGCEEISTKRESRGLQRRVEKFIERDTDRGGVQGRRGMERAELERGINYSYKSAKHPGAELYKLEGLEKQQKYSNCGYEGNMSYALRREDQAHEDSKQSRPFHRFNNPSQYNPNQHQVRQSVPNYRSNYRNNTEHQNKLLPDQCTETFTRQAPTSQIDSSNNGTPTRLKNMPRSQAQGLNDGGLSQSRRQLLIEKSKNLSERMNELSGSKKLGTSASKDQKQFRFHAEIDQERIDRIKNNKDRVYDSPFKEKIKSSADLKLKYQTQSEACHQYGSTINSTGMAKPRNPQSVLRNSDTNEIVNSIQRSQELIKKLNQVKESSSGMGKKTNTENEASKAYQSHTGSIDSNCMNRINALNSKINEKISLLINTYEK